MSHGLCEERGWVLETEVFDDLLVVHPQKIESRTITEITGDFLVAVDGLSPNRHRSEEAVPCPDDLSPLYSRNFRGVGGSGL